MKKIKFEVLGTPVAKGRPRLGKFRTYTPHKTKNYEELIKLSFINKYSKFDPFMGELRVNIDAIFEVPKSYSQKKKVKLLNTGYTHRPDVDNLTKAVLDALNGLAYKDDAQVCSLNFDKYYGKEAKVIIEIEEVLSCERTDN